MKTTLLITVALSGYFVAFQANAQYSPRQLSKKAIDANASENRALKKSLNEPTPAAPSAPATVAPVAPSTPTRVATNSVPEKTAAQKAQMLQKTIEFQKKRAEGGAPTAQYDLGIRYLNGDGVEQNAELAQKWLQALAER